MISIVMNNPLPLLGTLRILIVASKIFSVTALEFFYTLSAPLCLTRENARQGTAGRGF